VSGQVYDVAVTVDSTVGTATDVYYGQWDGPLQDEAWSEGWHAGAPLDYVTLGLHANSFTLTPKATLVQQITAALDGVNHISVYGTGYGPNGMHLVHRNNGADGALVLRPLSETPHFLVFHFTDQNF
jgi:hypothetical protein